MPTPISRPKIIKKAPSRFRRHQADNFKRISRTGYRRPRGIDNRMRRGFRGCRPLVSIGYGSNKKTRHMLQNHMYKFIVHTADDVNLLLMHNREYAAQIAHGVGARKRREIIERAAQLDVKVLNAHARMRTIDTK